jgi:hypothetical protein
MGEITLLSLPSTFDIRIRTASSSSFDEFALIVIFMFSLIDMGSQAQAYMCLCDLPRYVIQLREHCSKVYREHHDEHWLKPIVGVQATTTPCNEYGCPMRTHSYARSLESDDADGSKAGRKTRMKARTNLGANPGRQRWRSKLRRECMWWPK